MPIFTKSDEATSNTCFENFFLSLYISWNKNKTNQKLVKQYYQNRKLKIFDIHIKFAIFLISEKMYKLNIRSIYPIILALKVTLMLGLLLINTHLHTNKIKICGLETVHIFLKSNTFVNWLFLFKVKCSSFLTVSSIYFLNTYQEIKNYMWK